MKYALTLAEHGYLPSNVMRYGIRHLCKKRLHDIQASSDDLLFDQLQNSPIAIATDIANQQHYELPPEFFNLILGPAKKYSACHWPDGIDTLADAELSSLKQIATRAQVLDGMNILELGCGWGSLSLWLAQTYPNCTITGVSNSHAQRAYIEQQCKLKKLSNLTIITADINTFETNQTFDRIISIEMFEHMRNHDLLIKKISAFLNPQGKLFIHVFCHKSISYLFEEKDESDWLTRYFFTGGMMPGFNWLPRFKNNLNLQQQWQINGVHYKKTAEAWLVNLINNKQLAMPLLEQTYGTNQAKIWYMRWYLFFLAVAELFGYKQGSEWFVGHYLFEK